MRDYYLVDAFTNEQFKEACRGGIREKKGENYELEIGHNCYASPEIVALCIFIDEITEFLSKTDSAVGQLIYKSYKGKVAEIRDDMGDGGDENSQ